LVILKNNFWIAGNKGINKWEPSRADSLMIIFKGKWVIQSENLILGKLLGKGFCVVHFATVKVQIILDGKDRRRGLDG